jgi:hypothetical protein
VRLPHEFFLLVGETRHAYLLVGVQTSIVAADLVVMRRLVLAAIVLALGGVGFVMHERKSAMEAHLGELATELGGRHVYVHCQSFAGNLVDISNEAGFVKFHDNGVPYDSTELKRPICQALQRFPHEWQSPQFQCVYALGDCPKPIWEDVLAVHTFAHEVWHLHGSIQEARTECSALQTTAEAATLFGADARSAQATALYALQRMYPNLPDDYRTPDCVNGGPYDLRPADPVWP